MHPLSLKPTHKPVKAYYEALKQFKSVNISHETAVRSAFQELLTHCCRQVDWKPFGPRVDHRPVSSQYRQTERITNDPNRSDDPEYIMRLIGQVITVSVETVKIVKSLPKFEVLSKSQKS